MDKKVGKEMKSVVFYDDYGTIKLVINERDFRSFYKLQGKTDEGIDKLLK